MKSIQLAITLGLLLTLKSCAQDKKGLIGEWTEVRREQRIGIVYDIRGRPFEPSIEISFSDNGKGTFLNKEIPVDLEPKMTLDYNVIGDTLLAFGRLYEIVKLQGDSLVLIRRSISKFKLDDDFKFYFLRKENYDKLSDSERKRLAAPTDKDAAYLKTVKSSKRDD